MSYLTTARFSAISVLALVVSSTVVSAQFGGLDPQFIDQETQGVPDHNEIGDLFGWALAAGDFEGDGYLDLVVSALEESINGISHVGQVTVIRGSATGLDPVLGAEVWNESLGLLTGSLDEFASFGASLATGDFNDDLLDDLAISVPAGDPVVDGLPVANAGVVYVLWGSGVGLTHQDHLTITRGAFGLPGEPKNGDRFGSTLASGDFNGDGVDDLALASQQCDYESPGGTSVNGAGCLGVLYGSTAGLDASPGGGVPGMILDLASLGAVPSSSDGFGKTLAAGDFNGDGTSDLAVAAPWRTVQGIDLAGEVFVLLGGEEGLVTANVQKINRGVPGLWGAPFELDLMGGALAAADFDSDGAAELVIGVGAADLWFGDEGLVYVVPGVVNGALDTASTVLLTQGLVSGAAGLGGLFGHALAVGDFDFDGHPDLAMSAPLASPNGLGQAGRAWILSGTTNGLLAGPGSGQEIFHTDGGVDGISAGDRFGQRLFAAELDGNQAADLVVGMPSFGAEDAGAVDIFYGIPLPEPDGLFQDGFETGDLSAWSAVGGE